MAESKEQIRANTADKSPKEEEKPPINHRITAPFEKVFTNEEEILLLEGLLRYWADGRKNDWVEFHDGMKHHLPRFTKDQLTEKIRNLKRKFAKNKVKAGFPQNRNDHEAHVHELSKKLWDEDDINTILHGKRKCVDDEEIMKVKGKRQQVINNVSEDFESAFPLLYTYMNDDLGSSLFFKKNIHLIGEEKALQLEEELKQLRGEDIQLYLKKMEFKVKCLQEIRSSFK